MLSDLDKFRWLFGIRRIASKRRDPKVLKQVICAHDIAYPIVRTEVSHHASFVLRNGPQHLALHRSRRIARGLASRQAVRKVMIFLAHVLVQLAVND